MQTILSYLGLAKYVVPVVDAVVAEVQAAIPAEKADVLAAFQAFQKTWADTKTAFDALVLAVKDAIAKA